MWGTEISSYITAAWSFAPRSFLAFATIKLSISAQNISGYRRQNEYKTWLVLQYPNTCSLSLFRVIKVRLGPQVPQEHLVPEGLQETQAEMGHRATQESRWDTCILSHMVFCACVCTELTHFTAVVTHMSHTVTKTRCSFSLSWTLYLVLGSDILHLLLHLCSWQMLPYQWHGFKNT